MSGKRLWLRNGTIIDGTGQSRYKGDVLVEAGQIQRVGTFTPPEGAEQVDVAGHVIAPGFIDMHSHVDLTLLEEPTSALKIRQGVTTEVIGQDGISYAPASEEGLKASRDLFAPVNGRGATLDWSWRSVAEYLERFDAIGPNIAYLLPQGTIRFSVIGLERRAATAAELREMKAFVQAGMEEGAFGISTGLTYPPGAWTPTEEIIELSAVAGTYGGIYVTHHRDYGADLMGAIEEALEIGVKAEIPVHFSHFHVSGPGRAGDADRFLALLEAARGAGQRVTLDVYPYEAGCTVLTAFLPDWLRSKSTAQILDTLRDPAGRRRAVADLKKEGPGKTAAVGWEGFVIGGAAGPWGDAVRGKRLTKAAHEHELSVEEFIAELLVSADGLVCVVVFQGHESNIHRVLQDRGATIGTDGIMGCNVPHPRAAGTYPRLLRYASEGRFELEAMIEMMTGRAARALQLHDRGTIIPGLAADLVVFDPADVSDRADYSHPTAPPTGIHHVLINGEFVIRDSVVTGSLPGKVLRKS